MSGFGNWKLHLIALIAAIVAVSSNTIPAEDASNVAVDEGDDVIKHGQTGAGQALPRVILSPLENVPDQSSQFEATQPESQSSDSPATPPNDDEAEIERRRRSQNSRSGTIGSHFYLNHRGGGQFGQASPDTAIGLFYPVNVDDGILFVQPQVTLDNYGDVGGAVSLGRRWFDRPADRVYGAALSWDMNQTRMQRTVQQGVLSLETRGEVWDGFANGYLPLSDRTELGNSASFGTVTYEGSNLVAPIIRQASTSMAGGDLQVARRLGDYSIWAFGGWYHLEGGGRTTDGFLTGIRGYAADQVLLDGTVSNDGLFGTNVGFSVTLFFGGSARGQVAPSSVFRRMAEPLNRRDTSVQFDRQVVTGSQVLTRGGNPVTVAHVNSVGGAGTGTAATPYGSLAAAAGTPANIVLLHADSVFNGEQFSLLPGQMLLGDGNAVSHVILTDQLGATQLPRATGGSSLPTIVNSPGNAITMAANSTVSGIRIQNAGGAGIFGNSAGPMLIDRVTVQGSAGPGVLIVAGGTDVIDVTVRNSLFGGNAAPQSYQFGPNAGAVLNLNLTENEDSAGYAMQRDPNGFLRLQGTLGIGGLFNDDNGNIANNGNTTLSGLPNTIISGAGNQIQIVSPGSIIVP